MPQIQQQSLEGLKNIYRRARETFVRKLYPQRTKQFLIEGQKINFLISDPVAEEWYGKLPESHTSNELKFLKQMIANDEIILECGAHHGFTTIHLAKYAPQGKVIALEAFPRNAEILERNIKDNQIENVQVINAALSGESGKAKISYSSNTTLSDRDQNTIEVDAYTLNDLTSYQPTFLKIDIEGFEYEALQMASKALASRPKIALEVHTQLLRRRGIEPEEVTKFIKLDNYDYFIEYGGEMPKPYNWEPITDHCHLFGIPTEKAINT